MIESLIVDLSRRDVGLHRGDVRAVGHFERRRPGQLLGTRIPHAAATTGPAGALVITMVETAFVGSAMPSARCA